jgi:hypothetical protein
VTKLNPSGQVVYIAYLGGSSDDRAYGVAVDGSGSAVVVGWTYSTNFPVANAVQPFLGGGRDGFVAKLNASGSGLVFQHLSGRNRLRLRQWRRPGSGREHLRSGGDDLVELPGPERISGALGRQ